MTLRILIHTDYSLLKFFLRSSAERLLKSGSKIAFCRNCSVFSDFKNSFWLVAPCGPVGQALSIRIARFGEVGPVSLDQ